MQRSCNEAADVGIYENPCRDYMNTKDNEQRKCSMLVHILKIITEREKKKTHTHIHEENALWYLISLWNCHCLHEWSFICMCREEKKVYIWYNIDIGWCVCQSIPSSFWTGMKANGKLTHKNIEDAKIIRSKKQSKILHEMSPHIWFA